ncbi:MAG TPA: hypothetical protein VFD36_05265 [Kofleriaceae bacterium]|nr:hypothetical protein [Kofleriaceae bacterium]
MKWLWVSLLLALVGTALAAPTKLTMRRSPPAHGGFVDEMDCSACHTTGGWKLAPSAGGSGFDHDRTGFSLRGQHARATCTGCHTGTKPARSCEGCHRDPHAGRHDEPCAECHTAVAWSDTNALEQHRRTRMPLTGRHAAIDCTSCHKRQAGRTFSDLPADCYACHRERFHDRALHPAHDGSTGDAPFSRDCGLCHQTSAWTPAYANPSSLRRDVIARSGDHDRWFVLSSGSHRTSTCTSCHADTQRLQQVRCDGCHDTLALRRQHRGAIRPAAAGACLRCHPRGIAR